MSNVKLHYLQRDRASNIRTMAAWSWSKTGRHIDLIEQQIVWAVRQRNLAALDYLEERRRMFDFYGQSAISDSRKSGEISRQLKDARRMKAHGDDIAYISEITELPIEEIERL